MPKGSLFYMELIINHWTFSSLTCIFQGISCQGTTICFKNSIIYQFLTKNHIFRGRFPSSSLTKHHILKRVKNIVNVFQQQDPKISFFLWIPWGEQLAKSNRTLKNLDLYKLLQSSVTCTDLHKITFELKKEKCRCKKVLEHNMQI